MKIISIGFKNPFHESGYTNKIKINGLDEINVFIGKNNSGKTNVLKSIYNLLHQDIERSEIFRRIKVKLDKKDFELIIEKFHKKLLLIYKNKDIPTPEANRRENRLKSTLKDGKFVNQFYPLFNLMKDYPIPKNFSIILNFNNDIPNKKLLFDYIFENINNLNKEIHKVIEDILKKISLDQDLLSILIDQVLPFKKIILIPSFRTLETSEKKYQGGEIREITGSIAALLDTSFDRIPVNAQKSEPFKIPNLALILSIIKENQMIGAYKEIMNQEFFENFNTSLRKIFPDIDLSINFKLTELTTNGGYKEYGKNIRDWTKLGHGTQQLISLLFLLILPRDCVYIIDEPENGLHPGLQLKLLRFIKDIILTDKSYSKQFFFATHSTCFIDFKGACSHYVCKKSKEKFSVGLLKKEYFFIIREELGHTPSSLLQASGIIWVEGPSDPFYVNMLFKCFKFNLEENGVLVVPYFGVGNIISKHLSIERLKNINPNFIVIMDSHILRPNTRPKQKVSRIKKDFEKKGHKFWLIDQYYEIEGFIPQKVIEDFLQLKNIPKREKNPYEPLNNYITFLKNNKEIDDGSPNYNKVDHASLISKLILYDPNYAREIRQNNYIAKNIKEIIDTIDLWNNRFPSSRIIENHPIDDWSGISIIPPSESRKMLGNIKKIVPENDMDDHELFQISKFINEFTIKQSKMQIIDFFNHYEKEGKDYKDQRMVLIYFNDLLDENKLNLEKIGFVYIRNRNIIQDENFAISIKKNKNDQFDRFLIRKLKKGKKLEPDKVYYSTDFSKKYKKLSEKSVLEDFIKYLKFNEF